MTRRRIRITARLHLGAGERIVVSTVQLDEPPVAIVAEMDSLMGLWWFHAGGYPVGRLSGTLLE